MLTRVLPAGALLAGLVATAGCSPAAPVSPTAVATDTATLQPTLRPSASPSPAQLPAPRTLLALLSAEGPDRLMYEDGVETGSLPQTASTPSLRSRFGAQLFGILNQGGQLPGGVTLEAIDSTGRWRQLEPPMNRDTFVDAIGSEDGESWGWITTSSPCSASAAATLHMAGVGGAVRLVALPRVDGRWNALSFNAAGIVVQAAACSIGSSVVSTALVDPVTAAFTNLDARLGGGCDFAAIADTGALLCTEQAAPGGVRLVLVPPNSRRRTFAVLPAAVAACPGVDAKDYEGVTLSADARYASISFDCQTNGARRDQLSIVDMISGAVTEGPRSLYLAGLGWLSDDTLVATHPSFAGTYVVSAAGSVRTLATDAAAQWTD